MHLLPESGWLSEACCHKVALAWDENEAAKKSPTVGPTERTPKTPEYLIGVATYEGKVRWDSVPFNFWWNQCKKNDIMQGGWEMLEDMKFGDGISWRIAR